MGLWDVVIGFGVGLLAALLGGAIAMGLITVYEIVRYSIGDRK